MEVRKFKSKASEHACPDLRDCDIDFGFDI
jgi:hypothetical protein